VPWSWPDRGALPSGCPHAPGFDPRRSEWDQGYSDALRSQAAQWISIDFAHAGGSRNRTEPDDGRWFLGRRLLSRWFIAALVPDIAPGRLRSRTVAPDLGSSPLTEGRLP